MRLFAVILPHSCHNSDIPGKRVIHEYRYVYVQQRRKQTRSPLSLYSEYQRMEIEFRAPHIMPTSHWHGQVEVNVPFDGDVEYLINNEKVSINQDISRCSGPVHRTN